MFVGPHLITLKIKDASKLILKWKFQIIFYNGQRGYKHKNDKPYEHVKHFIMQRKLQIHLTYICFLINNLIGVYKLEGAVKFEKSIWLKHELGKIKFHAWCENIKVSKQVQRLMSQRNYQ